MGEYALHNGERVKIGTCECMYYLRWDQAHLVTAIHGNVNPLTQREHLLFRFPWPDEDYLLPGTFDSAWGRGMTLRGMEVPEGVDHGIMQFTSRQGYLLNAPCPEATGGQLDLPDGFRLHKNGYGGAVRLVGQRWWEDRLVGVFECKGCDHLWRAPTIEDAEPALVAIRAMADREERTADLNGTEGNRHIARTYHRIADRLAYGYTGSWPVSQIATKEEA